MSVLENKLQGWTGPSSNSEKEKQERTERMIREAVREHPAFEDCSLQVYAKGSYANNTNVRADSDVDIAVQCNEVVYYDSADNSAGPEGGPYMGPWTPSQLRNELEAALRAKFPYQVDTSGSTAIKVSSGSARVEADVVPCFNYRYYFSSGGYRSGAKVFKKNMSSIENYPQQQVENGKYKNLNTHTRYKKAVRVMKRLENAMVESGYHREVPSFFVECLVYNVPNHILTRGSWVETVKGILAHIYEALEGNEPSEESRRWLEVNECKFLFHSEQKWTRADGQAFAYAGWNYLEFGK